MKGSYCKGLALSKLSSRLVAHCVLLLCLTSSSLAPLHQDVTCSVSDYNRFDTLGSLELRASEMTVVLLVPSQAILE
eukprot:5367281-Amphidinium_carterae.3